MACAPIILVAISVITILFIQLDKIYETEIDRYSSILFSGTPDAARQLSSTIAMSTATIVTVVFSITIVALQLSSSQYSSRVLRTFTTDRSFQVVLGLYIATYLSSLIILRSIRSADEAIDPFVPQLSIAFSMILVVMNVGNLVYFINRVSSSLQVSSIMKRIHDDILEEIKSTYDQEIETSQSDLNHASKSKSKKKYVYSTKTGFINDIEKKRLNVQIQDTKRVYLLQKIGDFISVGTPLALIETDHKSIDLDIQHKLQGAFVVSSHPTIRQNVLFGIQQLVDIALRAIDSNDQTTVMYAINYLRDILIRLSKYQFIDEIIQFKNNNTFFIVRRTKWNDFIQEALSQIANNISSKTHLIQIFHDNIHKTYEAIKDREKQVSLKMLVDNKINTLS